jgi:Rps23 Pro-64 3,4-dihydroxylase Tpa1-like proline 4-hydroxylase
MKALPFKLKMEQPEIESVANEISAFLSEYGVEHSMHSVWSEREWTDFRITINDPQQMERIDTWLREDIKQVLQEYNDIEISAPNPLEGREDELRIRIYALD